MVTEETRWEHWAWWVQLSLVCYRSSELHSNNAELCQISPIILCLSVLQLENLFKDFDQPIRIELTFIEPAADPDKTEIAFMSFAASKTESVQLPVEDQLDYLRSLNTSNITIKDLVVHWDGRWRWKPAQLPQSWSCKSSASSPGIYPCFLCLTGPDLYVSSKETVCPRNSLCINALGSYTCVCRHGYYNVSSFVKPPVASRLVCNGKASNCLFTCDGSVFMVSACQIKIVVILWLGLLSVDKIRKYCLTALTSLFKDDTKRAVNRGTSRKLGENKKNHVGSPNKYLMQN